MAKELSIFVDESGDRGGKARYYLLTLVFHDQADSIAEAVTGYEAKLAKADLPNIPFHSEPLMNGHMDYEFLGIGQRKAMLAYFSSFVRKLPISYITFVYRRSQFEDPARLMERMGRDISSAMVEHLDFFQSFDDVKVHYDNGQDIVKQALDRSVGKVLSKGGRPAPQDLDDQLTIGNIHIVKQNSLNSIDIFFQHGRARETGRGKTVFLGVYQSISG